MTMHDHLNQAFRSLNRGLRRTFGTIDVCGERSQRVRIHWQNLNDSYPNDEVGPPVEGRCWLHINLDGKSRDRIVQFAWHLWRPMYLAGASFEMDPSGEDGVKLNLRLWPASLWLSFDNFLPRRLGDAWQRRYGYSGRELAFNLSIDNSSVFPGLIFTYDLWRDPDSWSSKEPKWRRMHVDLMDKIFGQTNRIDTTTVNDKPVKIPMPEGIYDGTVTFGISRFKRPRLPFIKIFSHGDVKVPIGVPHEGKGENDWDCGEDASYGLYSPAKSETEAVINFISNVLKSRMKYNSRGILTQYPTPEEREKRVIEVRAKAEAERLARKAAKLPPDEPMTEAAAP